jgi:glycosyltransferase involved in cell wall biosynthesis
MTESDDRTGSGAARLSIVIPARNEARNLEEVLPRLPRVHQIIVVDGHSVDDTVATARRVRPDVQVVHQDRRGKGNALNCGFRAATGDIIVMFDADGSADPAEIPRFVAALLDGADVAQGSRFGRAGGVRGGSHDITPLRRAGNAALNVLANTLFQTRSTDLCYGYNAFWRDVVPLLELPECRGTAERPGAVPDTLHWGDGFEIETLLHCRAAAARLVVAEVPSVELRRLHGVTNLRTFADGARVLRTLLAEFRRARTRRRAGARSTRPTPVADGTDRVGAARAAVGHRASGAA